MALPIALNHPMIRNDINMVIYGNIGDPKGEFGVPAPRAVPPPTATVTPRPVHEDVLALNILILQGDQFAYHQCSRHQGSQEQPPTHFLEDESDYEDVEPDEVDAGSAFGPPGKVTERNVATVGPLDKGAVVELEFGPVLEAHVPASPAK